MQHGITQNIQEILSKEKPSTMLSNSELIIMLNQSATDREKLAKFLSISEMEKVYITNVDIGEGLIRVRNSLVPFKNQFPKDTELYKLMTTKIEEQKLDMAQKIYGILCTAFGKPPVKFDFEYTNKKDEFYRDSNITPMEFYDKYIKELNLDDYISIINAPNEDRPYYKKYTVNYIGNVAEGNKITYLNLPINRLKEMAVAQLTDGVPVFFGSDVGQESSRSLGIMSRNLFNIQDIINFEDNMDKATKLEYRESCMTHAMMFLGVNLDENWKGSRWKVENSWGHEPGNKGIFVLTDDWFNSYVYQVVINKKHLKPEELEAYNENKYYMELEPWDPMGTLANMN